MARAAGLKALGLDWLKQSWLIDSTPVSTEMLPVSAAVSKTVKGHYEVDWKVTLCHAEMV